ncbi:hypothetical protein BKA62DRAFT_717214 [Auriculariales sp. MPI-PUGE-AT-0066]|nr:hypothetical protein BKA62DRAFT_717214 [Auriculariales sp. MPI-PUGE-AT-0066]
MWSLPSSLKSERILLVLICALSIVTIVLTVQDLSSGTRPTLKPPREYSYIGKDHPRTWPIELRKVHKPVENSIHYALGKKSNGDLGSQELASIMPRGGGVVHLGPEKRPFSRCLEILTRDGMDMIEKATVAEQRNITLEVPLPSPVAHHCIGYLRQMILCRSDTKLESGRRHVFPRITTLPVTHVCNDWSAAYAEAERNYEEYRAGRDL